MSMNFSTGINQGYIPLDSDSYAYIMGNNGSGGGSGEQQTVDIATVETAGICKPDDVSIKVDNAGTFSVDKYAMMLTYEELPSEEETEEPDVGYTEDTFEDD